jgi:hypothetical protein
LRGSAEANEKLALDALHSGRFAQAEQILAQALPPLADEPALAEERGNLEAMRERTHRLARFYQLAGEAQRREEVQSDQSDFFADSGAEKPCYEGLAQLGVFEKDEWWKHLPVADLLEVQAGELQEDVYHQLILLAAIRGKRAATQLSNPQEFRPLLAEGFAALKQANRFSPDTFLGERLEALCLYFLGEGDKVRPFTNGEPQTAADHYFLGLFFLGIVAVEQSDARDRTILIRKPLLFAARILLGLDVSNPGEKAILHLRKAADLRPRHYWAHCWLAFSLWVAGQVEAAEQTYAICVALRPDYATAYELRAALLMEQ